ncbi:MAG: HNH endonuclease [Caldilinea sp.]|nr:HNH endonuclease [Caldilinea sp.]MCB0146953.1 HNH endonuclease [Caldilineaceae bacterium]MCO5210713.1 HNH endonuclease [Caldilinea sp.]MCW5843419.1 HNH endonuclease [Caldilinea sp.]HRW47901.1 HNH endonuclease [Caldilinea sp.]
MPTLGADILMSRIEDAFAESGAYALLLSSPHQRHPRSFIVQFNNQSTEIWIYIWTLTHGGGRMRPVDEYRIQLTGVASPLQLNPNGPTLLLGYEVDRNCFAGFDIQKHLTFTGRSPSIQIRIGVLDEAARNGIAFSERKGNNEIAVAFRPDYFMVYALNALLLHEQAVDAATIHLLERIANHESVAAVDLDLVAPERQRVVSTVARLTRAADFRRRILQAYSATCAVTGLQLRLVDAAHILPVGADGSSDMTANGLCLSPTFHRAFDSALIYLDETSYTMHLNTRRVEELRGEGLDGGVEQLAAHLGRRILLPQDMHNWPNQEMIRRANAHRQISP